MIGGGNTLDSARFYSDEHRRFSWDLARYFIKEAVRLWSVMILRSPLIAAATGKMRKG